MNTLREHILLKFAIVFLVAVLVTPSIVKLSHVFLNHEHEVCTSDRAYHLHKVDVDCEFYKFKKTGESYISQNCFDIKLFSKAQKKLTFYYLHHSSHQQLNVSLRGPPLT